MGRKGVRSKGLMQTTKVAESPITQRKKERILKCAGDSTRAVDVCLCFTAFTFTQRISSIICLKSANALEEQGCEVEVNMAR